MIITIRNKWLLRLFWRRMDIPSYVTAHHRMWFSWLIKNWITKPHLKGK